MNCCKIFDKVLNCQSVDGFRKHLLVFSKEIVIFFFSSVCYFWFFRPANSNLRTNNDKQKIPIFGNFLPSRPLFLSFFLPFLLSFFLSFFHQARNTCFVPIFYFLFLFLSFSHTQFSFRCNYKMQREKIT